MSHPHYLVLVASETFLQSRPKKSRVPEDLPRRDVDRVVSTEIGRKNSA